jgi:hypothetical protein
VVVAAEIAVAVEVMVVGIRPAGVVAVGAVVAGVLAVGAAAVAPAARVVPTVAMVSVGAGGLAADQDPGDGAVAGQPPARLRRQRPDRAGLPTHRPRVAEEAFQVDGHRQLGPHPTGLGQVAALQDPAGQLPQGIGPALATATRVGGAGRAGQGL